MLDKFILPIEIKSPWLPQNKFLKKIKQDKCFLYKHEGQNKTELYDQEKHVPNLTRHLFFTVIGAFHNPKNITKVKKYEICFRLL